MGDWVKRGSQVEESGLVVFPSGSLEVWAWKGMFWTDLARLSLLDSKSV